MDHEQALEDYHGHPNYVKVWLGLVALLGISLVLGAMGAHLLAVLLIFGIAVVKALMVAGSFMHLRWEPRLLVGLLIFAVLCAGFLYFGVYPDIVNVPMQVAK